MLHRIPHGERTLRVGYSKKDANTILFNMKTSLIRFEQAAEPGIEADAATQGAAGADSPTAPKRGGSLKKFYG